MLTQLANPGQGPITRMAAEITARVKEMGERANLKGLERTEAAFRTQLQRGAQSNLSAPKLPQQLTGLARVVAAFKAQVNKLTATR